MVPESRMFEDYSVSILVWLGTSAILYLEQYLPPKFAFWHLLWWIQGINDVCVGLVDKKPAGK